MRHPAGQVAPKADEDDDVVRAKGQGIGQRKQKRSPEDGDQAHRRRQIELADGMPDDGCAMGNHDPVDGGIADAQVALDLQQLFMDEFFLQFPDMAFDLVKGEPVRFDSIGGGSHNLIQGWQRRIGGQLHMGSSRVGDTIRDAMTDLAMQHPDLIQERGRLTVQSKHMYLAVHTLGDGENRLIEGAAGEGEFLPDPGEQLKRQHRSNV